MRIERIDDDVVLSAGGPAVGSVRPPGSKSLTNRYLVCAALADGDSELSGASVSDDSLIMVDGLRGLGMAIDQRPDGSVMEVRGCRGLIPADEARLDLGGAGTAVRFLTAMCCLGHGRFVVDGSARMRERPIGDLVDALIALGAGIGYGGRAGFVPLTIRAGGLGGGEVHVRQPPSSQFLSALLMVAPYARDDVFIAVDGDLPSRPYVDMTVAMQRAMGVESLTSDDGRRWVVAAGQRYAPGRYAIEPDASAATYFWAAAAITGGRVRVEGLSRASLQGDVGFADVLAQMGCVVQATADSITVAGPAPGELRGVDVDLNAMPDAAQTLAVAALFARGPTTIRNVGNLRVKETDRLAALARELSKLGAAVSVGVSDITIEPPVRIAEDVAIETYDDHRMAMSFALAGLVAKRLRIGGAACVRKSVPAYFESLAALGHERR